MSDVPSWVTKRYRVLEQIGEGNYTTVYRVQDSRGNDFALKVLDAEYRDVVRVRDRFVTEAKAMTRLVHRNIVRIFDVGGAMSNEPAIVMEYMAGGTLRGHVPKNKGLGAGPAGRMALLSLAGLADAHKNGVTHRGLCPEVILLDGDGRPKISDFGVARLEKHRKAVMTMSVETLGSLFYTSPEQRAKAHDADPRSDVYAMGALLYFLLLGRDPPDLSEAEAAPALLDGLHEKLKPIVIKATLPERERRYADATEMGRALRGLFTR